MVKDEFEKLMHLQAQEFSEKMKKTLEDHESVMVLLKKELQAVDLERQTLRGAHSELNFKLTTERMKIQDMSNKYTLVTSENQRLKLKIVDLQDFEKEKQEFKACKNQFQNIINQMFEFLNEDAILSESSNEERSGKWIKSMLHNLEDLSRCTKNYITKQARQFQERSQVLQDRRFNKKTHENYISTVSKSKYDAMKKEYYRIRKRYDRMEKILRKSQTNTKASKIG